MPVLAFQDPRMGEVYARFSLPGPKEGEGYPVYASLVPWWVVYVPYMPPRDPFVGAPCPVHHARRAHCRLMSPLCTRFGLTDVHFLIRG